MFGGKTIAIILILGVLLFWFRSLLLWVIGILVLLYVVRWLADIYWWGKDNGKW